MAARTGKTGGLGMLAFIAIIIMAVAYIWLGIEKGFNIGPVLINGRSITGILQWVASSLGVVVMVWASYDFASRQTKVWRIIWWVLAVLAILAVIGLGGWNVFKL